MSDSVGRVVPVASDSQQAAGTSGEPTHTRTTNRLLWADCAKGLSIIAVCYMHVVTGVPGGQASG